MKVAVAGLWHLGLVTVACLARAGHQVLAYDGDMKLIENISRSHLPIFEPGLTDLVTEGITSKKLIFTAEANKIEDCNIVWITYDTPINSENVADIEFVFNECEKIFQHVVTDTLIIVSSQLPVGSCRKLQKLIGDARKQSITFACIPENLRLGKAIEIFTKPDRFVVGLSNQSDQTRIIELLKPFTENFIWMELESAEMTKHAVNAFLAASVTFINELAVLCEEVGADAFEVERGLKSEERIGAKAYLHPGNAIAGGTLARDVQYLSQLAETLDKPSYLLKAISSSNHYHQTWLFRKIEKTFSNLKNKTFALLGLTYKADTNTLRGSFALKICDWLNSSGCKIKAYDPAITFDHLPLNYSRMIELCSAMDLAVQDVDAIIVNSDWPEFKNISPERLSTFYEPSNIPIIFDPVGILVNTFTKNTSLTYFTIGISNECN